MHINPEINALFRNLNFLVAKIYTSTLLRCSSIACCHTISPKSSPITQLHSKYIYFEVINQYAKWYHDDWTMNSLFSMLNFAPWISVENRIECRMPKAMEGHDFICQISYLSVGLHWFADCATLLITYNNRNSMKMIIGFLDLWVAELHGMNSIIV